MVDKKTTLAKLPDADYNQTWPRDKDFKYVKKSNDPRFGEVTIKKNHATKEVVFVKEKLAHSQKEATKDIKALRSRNQLNHPNMLPMLGYSSAVKKNLCSTSYLTQGFYRYPQTDMARELKERKKSNTKFSNQELNKLRDDMSQSLHHLHSKNLNHGDIRPIYVGQNKQTQTHMLLDRFKSMGDVTKVQTENIVDQREIFMGPELWRKLKGKKRDQKFSPQKNDSFALGMTLL